MTKELERKVWLCWCMDWKERYVVKVYDNEEKAVSWLKQAKILSGSVGNDSEKFSEIKEKFEQLGLSDIDVQKDFDIEEKTIE